MKRLMFDKSLYTKKFNYKPMLLFALLYVAELLFTIISTVAFKSEDCAYSSTKIFFFSKLFTFIVIIYIFIPSFKDCIRLIKENFRSFILMLLAGIGLFLVANYSANFYQTILERNGIGQAENQNTILEFFYSSTDKKNYIMLFITLVILAPIIEEFEYRELMFSAFSGCKWVVGFLASALMFSFAHIVGSFSLVELIKLPVYLLPGIALALTYHLSKNNIFVSILIHAGSNCIAFLTIMYSL